MNKHYRTLFFIVLCAFTVIAAVGCAAPEKKKLFDESKLVWPKPPDPPRVKWTKVVYSDLDVREPSKRELMFGYEPGFVFRKPADVVVDKRGTAYVSELAYGFIGSFNVEEKTASVHKPKGIGNPLGLGYSEKMDWLAVVSPHLKLVRIFQLPEFSEKFVIDSSSGVELRNPVDAAIDAERGRIYVTDSKAAYIRVYDLKGKYLHDIGGPFGGPTGLFAPTFLDLDKDGNIYVVEVFNFRFHVFSPDGESLATVGEHGTAVGFFARPKGIAVDGEGHIYVSDAAFGNVQVFDLKGNVYLFFGGTSRFPGYFQIPEGMFIDHKDRLYVADQRNARVQIFQLYSDKYYEEHPEALEGYAKPVPATPEEAGEGGTPSESDAASTPMEPAAMEEQPADASSEPAMEEGQPEEPMTGEAPSSEEVQTPEEPAMEEGQPAGAPGESVMEEGQPAGEVQIHEDDPVLEGWEPADETGETQPAE